MRRLCLILLLIALLPLRAWVGDVMALQTLAPAASAGAESSAHAHCQDAAPSSAQPAAESQASAAPTDLHPDGSHCTACQVCHTVALADGSVPPAAQATPNSPPQAQLPADTSAWHSPEHRPPILLTL